MSFSAIRGVWSEERFVPGWAGCFATTTSHGDKSSTNLTSLREEITHTSVFSQNHAQIVPVTVAGRSLSTTTRL
jgi:hypothetical protein